MQPAAVPLPLRHVAARRRPAGPAGPAGKQRPCTLAGAACLASLPASPLPICISPFCHIRLLLPSAGAARRKHASASLCMRFPSPSPARCPCRKLSFFSLVISRTGWRCQPVQWCMCQHPATAPCLPPCDNSLPAPHLPPLSSVPTCERFPCDFSPPACCMCQPAAPEGARGGGVLFRIRTGRGGAVESHPGWCSSASAA